MCVSDFSPQCPWKCTSSRGGKTTKPSSRSTDFIDMIKSIFSGAKNCSRKYTKVVVFFKGLYVVKSVVNQLKVINKINFWIAILWNLPLTDKTIWPPAFQKRAAEYLNHNSFINNFYYYRLPAFIIAVLLNRAWETLAKVRGVHLLLLLICHLFFCKC